MGYWILVTTIRIQSGCHCTVLCCTVQYSTTRLLFYCTVHCFHCGESSQWPLLHRNAATRDLYCTILYCMYCTILYCMYDTVLYTMYCTILCCTVLYCTKLYCTVLYYTALRCTVLYCIAQYCTVLYYTVILNCGVICCTSLLQYKGAVSDGGLASREQVDVLYCTEL